MNKKIFVSLLLITAVGLLLHFYKINQSPPCLNADEASFAYNAYSILKTGKDEYGTLFPLRLKSFGDYKMPLMTYLSIPFIAIFGLNEFSIKLLNSVIILFFPFVVYSFSRQFFKNKNISLLAALLSVLSWGIQSMGRQLHEALLTSFLVMLSALFFIKAIEEKKYRYKLIFLLSVFFSLFSYQSSRVFALFFFIYVLYYWIKKRFSLKFFIAFISILIIFGITDLKYKPTRVVNLLFFNNLGFNLEIDQLRAEGGPRFLYNKLTVGLKDVVYNYLKYFSPQFLITNGDENFRFGFPGLSPLTIVEYCFFLIGVYYLIKHKTRWRFYLIALLLVSPLTASLSWNTGSLTRSFFVLIPILIIISYGVVNFIQILNGKNRIIFYIILAASYLFFIFYNWDFYLNHYPKRGVVIQSWQCGYKQLTDYIRQNYSKYQSFYISKEHGEPYIFFLFYLRYPPNKYQTQARLSPPDQYGFGQIEKFDKFDFTFKLPKNGSNFVSVAYPHDFKGQVDETLIKKIKVRNEEIFWIYSVE